MASGLEKHLRAFAEGHVAAAILGERGLDIGTGGMLSHDPGLIARHYITWARESGDVVKQAALLRDGIKGLISQGKKRDALIVVNAYLGASIFLGERLPITANELSALRDACSGAHDPTGILGRVDQALVTYEQIGPSG
jgi:hypothetical protein